VWASALVIDDSLGRLLSPRGGSAQFADPPLMGVFVNLGDVSGRCRTDEPFDSEGETSDSIKNKIIMSSKKETVLERNKGRLQPMQPKFGVEPQIEGVPISLIGEVIRQAKKDEAQAQRGAVGRRRQIKVRIFNTLLNDRGGMTRQEFVEKTKQDEAKKRGRVDLRDEIEEKLTAGARKIALELLNRGKEGIVERYLNDVQVIEAAEKARQRIRESGYPVAGKTGILALRGMDSAVLADDGLRVFVGGAGSSEEGDHVYGFDDLASGRVRVEVMPRDLDRPRRFLKRVLGKTPDEIGTVRVVDHLTGKQFTLMGVEKPDEFVNRVRQVSGPLAQEGPARRDAMELQARHRGLFETKKD